MKFEIKNRFTGSVVFSLETESMRLCVEAAVNVGADLSRANLSRADLSGSYLSGADLSGANLYWADLSRANLSRADFSGANLSGADLSGANLSWADLSRANLSGTNLFGANLSWADFSRANLSGADLSGANLSRADFSGANLSGADLSGANLSRADLSRANLSGTNLSGSKGLNKHLCSPLLIMLDQPGKIRAYKLVNEKMEGPYNGGVIYKKGRIASVDNANTNDTEHCAAGINIATLDWCMKEWRTGYRILIVEFTAKDIAAIPIATDGKFRVHRCKVVGEKDLKEIGLIGG